jgi:hypothetical protein
MSYAKRFQMVRNSILSRNGVVFLFHNSRCFVELVTVTLNISCKEAFRIIPPEMMHILQLLRWVEFVVLCGVEIFGQEFIPAFTKSTTKILAIVSEMHCYVVRGFTKTMLFLARKNARNCPPHCYILIHSDWLISLILILKHINCVYGLSLIVVLIQ